jgi:hypothetical protein
MQTACTEKLLVNWLVKLTPGFQNIKIFLQIKNGNLEKPEELGHFKEH